MAVQKLNKIQLSRRTDTVWRDKVKVGENQKPIWRIFLKTPLSKKAGDLQWRILHSAVSVNNFVSELKKDRKELPYVLFVKK